MSDSGPPTSPELASLLDEAGREAKRYGHGEIAAAHVAAALARNDPEDFAKRFGDDARPALDRILASLPATYATPTPSASVTEAFAQASRADAPIDDLLTWLRSTLGDLQESPADAPAAGSDDAAPVTGDVEPTTSSRPGWFDGVIDVVDPDDQILGREDLVTEVLISLGRKTPAVPCLVGQSGSGRSAVLAAVKRRLDDDRTKGVLAGATVLRLRPEAARHDAGLIERVGRALDATDILAIDDLDFVAGLGTQAPDMKVLSAVHTLVVEHRVRLIVTLEQGVLTELEVLEPDLVTALHRIDLPPLDPDDLRALTAAKADDLAEFHGVAVPDQVVDAAISPPPPNATVAHPGLAIDRLDSACAAAAVRGADAVETSDLPGISVAARQVLDGDRLRLALEREVLGQALALDRVIRRLAVTRAQLDLRPERPDGVFLFVGPTGVGKTQMAKALCRELYGGHERLIRLDMSEYAEEWSLSRLIGPQPGYVGSTEPDSWLTTKVRNSPDTVILLDEIEKAHPDIWNTFLQVFDDGRLTDSRGNVASFADTVIVMTSNIGSRAFSQVPTGFVVDRDPAADDERAREAVREIMRPELVNRLDEIVVFHPLDRATIAAIADKEVGDTVQRLAKRGYALTVTPEVVQFLADEGYDQHYGARHLQRNVEKHLLEPLVRHQPGTYTTTLLDGSVEWVAE